MNDVALVRASAFPPTDGANDRRDLLRLATHIREEHMKKTAFSILIVAACLAFTVASVLGLRTHTATPHERSFQFEYKATVKDIPIDAKQVDLWIPVPHDSPFQRITDLQIESPYPYQTNRAQYGNKVLHISLNKPQQASRRARRPILRRLGPSTTT